MTKHRQRRSNTVSTVKKSQARMPALRRRKTAKWSGHDEAGSTSDAHPGGGVARSGSQGGQFAGSAGSPTAGSRANRRIAAAPGRERGSPSRPPGRSPVGAHAPVPVEEGLGRTRNTDSGPQDGGSARQRARYLGRNRGRECWRRRTGVRAAGPGPISLPQPTAAEHDPKEAAQRQIHVRPDHRQTPEGRRKRRRSKSTQASRTVVAGTIEFWHPTCKPWQTRWRRGRCAAARRCAVAAARRMRWRGVAGGNGRVRCRWDWEEYREGGERLVHRRCPVNPDPVA